MFNKVSYTRLSVKNYSLFIQKWFQPNSFGEVSFLEESYENMQKIQILKIESALYSTSGSMPLSWNLLHNWRAWYLNPSRILIKGIMILLELKYKHSNYIAFCHLLTAFSNFKLKWNLLSFEHDLHSFVKFLSKTCYYVARNSSKCSELFWSLSYLTFEVNIYNMPNTYVKTSDCCKRNISFKTNFCKKKSHFQGHALVF